MWIRKVFYRVTDTSGFRVLRGFEASAVEGFCILNHKALIASLCTAKKFVKQKEPKAFPDP